MNRTCCQNGSSEAVTLPEKLCFDAMCEQNSKMNGLSMCKVKHLSQSQSSIAVYALTPGRLVINLRDGS